MYVRVRLTISSSPHNDVLIHLSKKAPISHLQEQIFHKLNVPVEQQKLYFKGKEVSEL